MEVSMRTLVAVAASVVLAAPSVYAQTCSQEVDQLAQRYAMHAELPQAATPRDNGAPGNEKPATAESRGLPADTMKQSGGVIAPSEEGRGRVIMPPRTDSAMPTTPNVPPQTARGPTREPVELNAAKRSQM